MRLILYIIIVLSIISCSDKKKTADLEIENSITYEIPDTSALVDSTFKEAIPHASIKTSGSSSYRYDADIEKSDNMRGFDPPSEDDMDDNGMSRYMENNDEEGWY